MRDTDTIQDRGTTPRAPDLSKPERSGAPAPSSSGPTDAQRHRHRGKLYGWAIAIVVLLLALIAFVAANADDVTIDWIVADSTLSLVWVIFGAALIGWVIGIATSVIFRRRTRAGRAD